MSHAHGVERGSQARLAYGRLGQAFLHGRQVFGAGVLAHEHVVEHAARHGCGVGRAKAGVFDHHGQRHLGRVDRGKGHVEGVVALVLFDFGGVVLVLLAYAHRLRRAGFAGAEVGRRQTPGPRCRLA
jgi:hypothetical protein